MARPRKDRGAALEFPETQENEETIGYDPGLIYTDVFLIDIIFIVIYIYIYICLYMFMYIGYAK